MEIVFDANDFRRKGDLKSASTVLGFALDAATIGEPRWVNRISGFMNTSGSDALALNK